MVMSALPPKADMCSANRYFCFGPKADMAIFGERLTARNTQCASKTGSVAADMTC